MEQDATMRQRMRLPGAENANRIFQQERLLEQVATATVTAIATHWTEQHGQTQAVQPSPDQPPPFSYMDEAEYEGVVGFMPLVWRIIKLMCIGMVLLVSSLSMYGLFYVAVMPAQAISKPLYFDYTGDSVVRNRKKMEVPLSIHSDETLLQEELEYDNQCNPKGNTEPTTTCKDVPATIAKEVTRRTPNEKNNPWASIDLFSKYTPWQAVKPEVLPRPILQDRFLEPLQPYFVEVVLILPESQINQQNGMFGVSVELWSENQIHLATSVRSARLPHESAWVGVVRKICWIFPLILGMTDESRVIVVQAFRQFVETSQSPLRHVIVRLIQQSSATIDQHVEVTGGELRIRKEMNPFQEFLRHYFYTSAFIGTSFFFSLHVLVWFLFSMLCHSNPNKRDEPPCDLDENELDDLHLDGDEEGSWVSIANNSRSSSQQPRSDNDGIHVVGSNPEEDYKDNDSEWEPITALEDEYSCNNDDLPQANDEQSMSARIFDGDGGPSSSEIGNVVLVGNSEGGGVASLPTDVFPQESKIVKSQEVVAESDIKPLIGNENDKKHNHQGTILSSTKNAPLPESRDSLEREETNSDGGVGDNLVPVTATTVEESNDQQFDITTPPPSVRRRLGSETSSVRSEWKSPVIPTSPSLSYRLSFTKPMDI